MHIVHVCAFQLFVSSASKFFTIKNHPHAGHRVSLSRSELPKLWIATPYGVA